MTKPDITAATWNMGGGEPVGPTDAQVQRVLTATVEAGVTIFLGQEVQEAHDRAFLRELGLDLFRTRPESVVAWDPKIWTPLDKQDVILNPTTPFFRQGGSTPVYVRMAEVILANRLGQTVKVGSYHTPSSVQQRNAPERRVQALRESMATLSDRARASKTHAVLYGGDDNVDERKGYGPWDFMRASATGLVQLVAPQNTLGTRRVDDFRVAGLRRRGDGRVIKGPTDHNVHLTRLNFTA